MISVFVAKDIREDLSTTATKSGEVLPCCTEKSKYSGTPTKKVTTAAAELASKVVKKCLENSGFIQDILKTMEEKLRKCNNYLW